MMVLLSEYTEGSSSSMGDHRCIYDVFLSFRGVDTRLGFTDHLYQALLGANIFTFFDDEEIETGGDLKPELESAIKESRASVIVLSKNYANSSWCLDELVLILGERKASNQIVIPIFYHVEPTHVRKQQSSFGDAMAKHKKAMKTEKNADKRRQWGQKLDRWSRALTEVADLKGMNVDGRRETVIIEEIVKDIHRRLHISSRIPPPQLIGMADSKNFVTSWLKDTSSHTTDILTIVGMGGIGKTSLAKYVYGLHSDEFDTSSFIENISARCNEKLNGLLDIQKQLHDDLSKRSLIQINDVSIYTLMIENVMARKRVFLVLDDIDSLDQLDALLGSKGLHPKSKIIITTKDAWLTESCALFKVNFKPRHTKHLLEGLYEHEAQQLLCFNAFMSNDPKAGYEDVLEKLVYYCEGHPLALNVLGRSLHNRDVFYWEDFMEGLKKENGSPVNNVLRKSFDSLPLENDKELFKHISCFFVGIDRDFTETILKACDIKTRSGITNLIDKCLLSIGSNNELMMHGLLQEMGRFVVRQESPNKPWKRSRLWCHEESLKVLKKKNGKENLIGLTLDMRMIEKEKLHGSFELKTDALSQMYNLMLLQLNYVQVNGSYENFPEELRWLCMHGFPLKCIPSELQMDNLVALDMSYSNFESFLIWDSNPQQLECSEKLIVSSAKDKRLFRSLKILNLSFCKRLHSLVGFVKLPALERLIATNCNELLEVCESVKQCVELVYIDLSYCNKLEKLNISMLKKVKTLLLKGCNLGHSQMEIRNKDSAELVTTNNILEAIPGDCKLLTFSLSSSLVELSLENNNLYTESFPLDFSYLSMLVELNLNRNPISSMPNCVRSLPRLEYLQLEHCDRLKSVEQPPKSLAVLDLYYDESCMLEKVVFDPEMCPLQFSISWDGLAPTWFEIEGVIKIQPLASVEEKVLRSLGWSKLEFLNKMGVRGNTFSSEGKERQIQMFYEFGIFSTIYRGADIPYWITHRIKETFISFTIPASPNKLRGFNFCYVNKSITLPVTIISNISKKRTWIYEHCTKYMIYIREEGCYTVLSHWMFGKNDMEGGDEVAIRSVWVSSNMDADAFECGVSFVYDDGNADEEDVLGYYKSWNHIIGGDLTAFQLTTGQYFLSKRRVISPTIPASLVYPGRFPIPTRFKEAQVHFRALSRRKPNILGQVHEETGTSTSNALKRENDTELSSTLEQPNEPKSWIVYKERRKSPKWRKWVD